MFANIAKNVVGKHQQRQLRDRTNRESLPPQPRLTGRPATRIYSHPRPPPLPPPPPSPPPLFPFSPHSRAFISLSLYSRSFALFPPLISLRSFALSSSVSIPVFLTSHPYKFICLRHAQTPLEFSFAHSLSRNLRIFHPFFSSSSE